jgi:hypothetical protein
MCVALRVDHESLTDNVVFGLVGYINRMRGYHSQKDRLLGWEIGQINSYYYLPEYKYEMRSYMSIKEPMWGREFPVGWRDIDHDLPHVEPRGIP